jgi:hypothetical protein
MSTALFLTPVSVRSRKQDTALWLFYRVSETAARTQNKARLLIRCSASSNTCQVTVTEPRFDGA